MFYLLYVSILVFIKFCILCAASKEKLSILWTQYFIKYCVPLRMTITITSQTKIVELRLLGNPVMLTINQLRAKLLVNTDI